MPLNPGLIKKSEGLAKNHHFTFVSKPNYNGYTEIIFLISKSKYSG